MVRSAARFLAVIVALTQVTAGDAKAARKATLSFPGDVFPAATEIPRTGEIENGGGNEVGDTKFVVRGGGKHGGSAGGGGMQSISLFGPDEKVSLVNEVAHLGLLLPEVCRRY